MAFILSAVICVWSVMSNSDKISTTAKNNKGVVNMFVSSDQLRCDFSEAMSLMYQQEVPLYGSLLQLVAGINNDVLTTRSDIKNQRLHTSNLERLSTERHGAIRLGKASELVLIRRLFAVMGMYPVGYYDLSVAGIPVHSTAFRPLSASALSANPFRVFTSLLRLELIEDQKLRQEIDAILATRTIFSPQLLSLLETIESAKGVLPEQKEQLITQAIDVFRWHHQANVDLLLYEQLHNTHRLIADVVSFKGPHINHLTPSTLDIDSVQQAMLNNGIAPKAVVEGPPKRRCPILLRQTSFKALQETVQFPCASGWQQGSHTARFGEIEQRGIALTSKGQQYYDQLLAQVREYITPNADGSNAQQYMSVLERVFLAFPDTYTELRAKELAYFHYSICVDVNHKVVGKAMSLEQLIDSQLVRFDPIIYEDFLPVSAAGIFQSNLGNNTPAALLNSGNQTAFEVALQAGVADVFTLYSAQQQDSIDHCLAFFNT